MDSKIKSGGRRDRLGRDRIGKVAAVAALAVLIVSTACKHPPAIKRWPAEMVDETEPSKSPAVEVNFYLDTTGSMQGFLHQPPGEANYFREVLNQAKSTLAGAWAPDTSRFRFWGFGGPKPKPIEIIDYLDAKAYDGKRTFIDQAIHDDPPQEGKNQLPRVKIIVTDLFQDHNNMDKLAAEFSKALHDPGQAVGILAFQNPFDGSIDDLPNGKKLPRGAAHTLPFYMIFMGSVADVTHCEQAFSARLDPAHSGSDRTIGMVFAQRTVYRLQRKLKVSPPDPTDKKHAKPAPGYTQEDSKVPDAAKLGVPYLADVRRNLSLRIANECPDSELAELGAHMRIVGTPAPLPIAGPAVRRPDGRQTRTPPQLCPRAASRWIPAAACRETCRWTVNA